mgnify:CR=1 FL=1
MSWTRTRAIARYLNLVWNYHNKCKYLACVPFPRWDGGANDADEIRKLCLSQVQLLLVSLVFAIASWVLYSSISIFVVFGL